MTPEAEIYARLLADTLVMATCGGRIYPLMAPQGAAMPYLTYRRVSNVAEEALDAASDLATARIQIDAVASSYTAAAALKGMVRQSLNGWFGPPGGAIQTVRRTNDYDLDENDEAIRLFRSITDFSVSFIEA